MTTDTGGSVRALLVQCGEHLCALPLSQVRRVVGALPRHALPGAAPELLGLVEYAGEPLPLLDLEALVGAPPGATPQAPVTVIAWAGRSDRRELVGLAADAALEIVEVPLARVAEAGGGVVKGDVAIAGRAVRLLDLERMGEP